MPEIKVDHIKSSVVDKSKTFIATIVDNNDAPEGIPGYVGPTSDGAPVHDDGKRPTKGLCRVKVSFPDVDQIDKEFLPWSHIVNSGMSTGGPDSIGSWKIPQIGQQVLCKRVGANLEQILVIGEVNSTQKTVRGQFQKNYPNTWGFTDRTGTKAVVNMETEITLLKHTSGSRADIQKSGTVNVLIKDDLNVRVEDNVTDRYDGYHDEKIGEYRESSIGDYYNETVGGDFTGMYKGSFTETVNDAYVGSFMDSYIETIASDYTGTCSGSSTYTTTGDMSYIGGNTSNFSATSTVNITAGSTINMNAPLVTMSGNLTVVGSISALVSISIPTTSLGTHVHGGVKSGPSVTTVGVG